jgi:hypothetical protein
MKLGRERSQTFPFPAGPNSAEAVHLWNSLAGPRDVVCWGMLYALTLRHTARSVCSINKLSKGVPLLSRVWTGITDNRGAQRV